MTAAREFVALVRDGAEGAKDPQEQRQLLDYALHACDLMALQVNDLLEVARAEADRVRIVKSSAAIARIAGFAVAAFSHAAEARGVDLSLTIAPDLPNVHADEARVAQILNNLLSNALKFTAPGGGVHVGVEPSAEEAGFVQVAVRDSGCGIPADHLPHVCERLYQVPEAGSHFDYGGLGLGLYIVQDLVHRHGGTLRIESEVGTGSTFRFTLPVAQPDAVASAAA